MTDGEVIAAAASQILRSSRVALTSYVRVEGRRGTEGWFRSVIDRNCGVAVMANSEVGAADVYLTAVVGDREFIAIPDGSAERSWIVRDRDPGEEPDTGMDAVVWLLAGTSSDVTVMADQSYVLDLDKDRAITAAADPQAAAQLLAERPDEGRARVWLREGQLTAFLLDLPRTRRPKHPAHQRLVSVLCGHSVPPLQAPTADEREVEGMVTALLEQWPGGPVTQTNPPDPTLLELHPSRSTSRRTMES